MKKLLTGLVVGGVIGSGLILIIMFFVDNSRRHEQEGLRLVTNDSTANEKKPQQVLVYGDYMDLDSTDYLLIPLGMKTFDNMEDRGLRSKSSSEYDAGTTGSYRSFKYNFYSMDFGNCNNIIFYNKMNDETHLLLQQPAVISQFYFPHYDKDYHDRKFWFILVGIREDDSNADGFLNSEDAEKVYICDLSGKVMQRITPDNTQLIDWFIDPSTNNILMKVRFDTNNDEKFSYDDEIRILKTAIDHPGIATDIIGKDIKENIKRILRRIK